MKYQIYDIPNMKQLPLTPAEATTNSDPKINPTQAKFNFHTPGPEGQSNARVLPEREGRGG